MVRYLLGLEHLPDVATISRTLARIDEPGVDNLQHLQHVEELY
jgi:hypothetical protein